MAKGQSFEVKAGVTRVQITRGDGSTMQIEAGEVRETKDPEEIGLLELHPDVKTAEKGGK